MISNPPSLQQSNITTFLSNREISTLCIQKRRIYNTAPSFEYKFSAAKEVATKRLVDTLSPSACLKFPKLEDYDKVFASCWVDSDTVLLGTKNNMLIAWDTSTNTYRPITPPSSSSAIPPDACGIHDVDVNGTKSLLVTGGQSPIDMVVFSLPSFAPVAILQGHLDWVFASKFLEDRIIVSASRDNAVCLWRIPPDGDTAMTDSDNTPISNQVPVVQPLLTRKEHTKKVRALQYGKSKMQLASLSADKTVKLWDRTNMDVVATISLPEQGELVCIAMDDPCNLLAVGSQQGTILLDTRSASRVGIIPSMNEDCGIRSLNFYHYLVSIGGGMGRLSFFDLRAMCHLASGGKPYLKAGDGWILHDAFYAALNIDTLPHAIYTHSFDPTRTKLLVAGGPLMTAMRGVYAEVW